MKTVVGRLTETAAVPDPLALPAEWAEWAEEPGQVIRVEEVGALLGTLHAVIVGRDEAWFEGLWVQPSARGRGVGRRLVSEAETLVRGYGAAIVRTAVPGRDYGALAVAERAGFVRHSEAAVMVADIPSGPIEVPYEAHVVPARSTDARAITSLFETAPHLTGWRGLVPLGWRFRRFVVELLQGLVRDGRVLRTGEAAEGPVEGAASFAVRGDTAIVSALAGPPAHRQALFGAVVERARHGGARRIALFVSEADVAEGLRSAFVPHPWCPDGLVIVEKVLTVKTH